MKLYAKCNSCKEVTGFWTNSSTRVEFAMNEGDTKKLRCKSCGVSNTFHVDEIEAKPSKLAQGIAALIFLVGTPLVFYFMWDYFFGTGWVYAAMILIGMVGFPMAIYGAIHRSERNRVNSFNRVKLKGKL